ncbi:MAG: type II CRISPR RNA-guided endonuclease Cas9, partial [Bacteroidota bacterium]
KRINYLKNNRDKVEVEEIQINKDGSDKVLTKVSSYENIPLHDYLGGKIWYDDDDNVRFDNADSVMFYQRPLRSQKALLGKCRYEPNKTPASTSHPDFEKYRIWQFVNSIRLSGNHKIPLRRRKDFVAFLLENKPKNKKKNIRFDELIVHFDLTYEAFNYEDDKTIPAAPANAYLKPMFAPDAWEEHYHEIWHDFYFYDDSERLFEKLQQTPEYKLKKGVDVETIEKIKLNTDDYASLSLKAIRNILPFLEMGYEYNEAVLLGGVMNAFNYDQQDDKPRWERIAESHDEIIDNVIRINREKGNKEGEAIEKIKAWLSDPENNFGFNENPGALKKLYHHSQEIEKKELENKISEIENLRNPVVQRSVQEMRRLVNKLMEEHGRFDRIAVEMGRELKQNKKRRNETQRNIQDNEKANIAAKEKLTEYGLRHSRGNIHKYLLFEEIQNKAGKVVCPYSGRGFNVSDLLGHENKVQIEHIIPRSKSQNDSFANKTLCDAYFNQQKGELTPYEFYQKNSDPKLWGVDSWDQVEQRAYRLLPFNKARRFTNRKKDWEQEDFVSRQLNDDRYISKKTKEILTEVCQDVVMMPGAVTADLRRLWGLNNVLQPNYNFEQQPSLVDAEKALPHWAVLNEKKEITKMYPQINPRPDVAAEEMCLTGYVDKGKFEVKELQLKLDAPEDIKPGKYYAKVAVNGPRNLTKRYIDRPETDENELVLRGRVSKKKFSHDSLKRKPQANLEDGFYFAKFKVENATFELPESNAKPENNKGIVLFGNVKDGVFSSYVFTCKTNLENGKYWALLDLDFENTEFIPTKNEKPTIKSSEFIVLGDVNDEKEFTPVSDAGYSTNVDAEPGRYWAVFELRDKQHEYHKLENEAPKTEKDESLIEGKVWVHDDVIRFDPKKNRDDHRHHAVDAIVIALTERSIVNKINWFNANVDEKRRNNYHEKPSFPEPWDGFRKDVQEQVDKILVSHHRDNPVLKKVKKKIQKNGKKYTSEGYAVRGQLHKETVFGGRQAPGMEKAYHVRKPVDGLKE